MSSAVANPVPQHPSASSAAPALDAETLRRRLQAGTPEDDGSAWQVRVVETTGSTNSDLLATVRAEGFTAPMLLAAERQTAGRGRLGRGWIALPAASLTASFALRVARPMAALDGATLVCGLAACDVFARHGVEARLKWPNDVLVDDGKLAGILVEALPVADGTVLVVGIGVNVEGAGPLLDSRGLRATDLRSAGGVALDRTRLAAELGLALQARLATFSTDGFAASVDEWNRRDAFRNQAVSLRAGSDACVTGVERGVDATGALLIDTHEGLCRIVSGDLSLRLATVR